ncbi:hypothetical protein [Lysobacter silvisoli]|uniref:Uncharacterized protein n=1 Tax=Lysobacter silvisoli TaxID=2293254 RepID=A0A371JWU1_9GAMM|nr:hypothetical protein [Lysobacter silvisoli]RDZ26139.1 hypothetical protein DX914_17855 [Lysobacter silvisoli]
MKAHLLPLLLLLPSLPALAGQCEDNFSKKGNALSGAEYSTSYKVPGLAMPNAIGQMRNLAIADGMDVLDESPDTGSLLLEEPANAAHKGLQVYVTAKADGTVSMLMKTRRGTFGSADGIRDAMCKMLTQLKPGKGAVARSAAKPIEIQATALATDIERQGLENEAAINVRFENKVYNIKGVNKGVAGKKGAFELYFDMNPSLVPGLIQSKSRMFEIRIACRMMPDQNAYSLAMRNGDKMYLNATYDTYDQAHRLVWLKNCRAIQ